MFYGYGMVVIEPSQRKDLTLIQAISEDVFSGYDAYVRLLPRFFTTQGVTTYMARTPEETVGFIMIGFLPWNAGKREGDSWIGDILAIAVVPRLQRRGIGRSMLDQAVSLVSQMADWRDVHEIQLTCAESNRAGVDFFTRCGFKIIDPHHGRFTNGQKALRMAKPFP
jgi:ribosomal protein S18 acetylase RimI-like enzyme